MGVSLRNRIATDAMLRQRVQGGDPSRWEDSRKRGEAKEYEYLARLREVPEDNRSITGRICGDPLVGRRALDQRVS